MTRRRVEIDAIYIGSRHREPDMAKVREIANSVKEIGLLNPPAVVFRDGIVVNGEELENVPVLIYGRHRLLALQELGEVMVECVVHDIDDLHAELMEISENLHRADLSALQRDEQVARWIELTKAREVVSSQVATKLGRPESGVNAAARELGISKDDAHRAVKVASLSPEAKAAAVEHGLHDNRTALLAAARAQDPAKQVEAFATWTRKLPRPRDERDPAMVERKGKRGADFLAAIAAIEPLLGELEYRGYPDVNDDGDPHFAYSGMTYLDVAARYKAVLGFESDFADGEGGGVSAGWRRIRNAQETLLDVLRRYAQAELTADTVGCLPPHDAPAIPAAVNDDAFTRADLPVFILKDLAA